MTFEFHPFGSIKFGKSKRVASLNYFMPFMYAGSQQEVSRLCQRKPLTCRLSTDLMRGLYALLAQAGASRTSFGVCIQWTSFKGMNVALSWKVVLHFSNTSMGYMSSTLVIFLSSCPTVVGSAASIEYWVLIQTLLFRHFVWMIRLLS